MTPQSKAEWRAAAVIRRQNSGGADEASGKADRGETAGLETTADWVTAVGRWLGSADAPVGWVVIFDPLPGEVDLWPLQQAAPDRPLALTRTPDEGFDLTVHPASSELELHRFGYRQPVLGAELVPIAEIGAVFVPALVFDRTGNRLGWGAGYYDRLLARVPDTCALVGIGTWIVDEELPAEAHDILMTHLATPAGVTRVG